MMVKINSKEIELFKNLSQYDFGQNYYDFHNDYNCVKILFENRILSFIFKNIIEDFIVSLRFDDVILEKFEFENLSDFKNFTIDNLYRGKFELNNELIEFSNDGKSYFYLEFYEGQKIEFWCESLIVERV